MESNFKNLEISVRFRKYNSEFLKMALLKYFKKIEPNIDEQVESILSKPHGSLSLKMPSSSIEAANCYRGT